MTRASPRRGHNAIEFSLVAPVLFALLTGIVDHGWFSTQRMAAVVVARDATRAAALTPLGEDVALVGQLQGAGSLEVAGLTGAVRCVLTGFSPDQKVRCDVDVPFTPIFGLVPLPRELRADLTMRMEEQP